MDVRAAVQRYVRHRRDVDGLSPNTITSIRYQLIRFADLHEMPIARVRRRHIERWLASLEVAATSKATAFSNVRTFFRFAEDHDWIQRDPTRGIRGPRVSKSLPKNMAHDEVHALLLHAPDQRARVILFLAVQDALRRGEVAGALIENIDRVAKVITVKGKGGKERIVPLSDETMDAIYDYLAVFPAARGPLIRSYSRPRHGITPGYVGKVVATWMRGAGVKRAAWDGRSMHALRHTAATDMIDQGADARDVQEILGHAYLSTTSIYTKRKAAMDRLKTAAGGRRYGGEAPAGESDGAA
jgi:site-specific recombinase XerD